MEDDHVARIEDQALLVVSGFLENSQRKASQRDLLAFSCVAKQRLLLPRICDTQTAPPTIPRREANRHKAPFDQALAQKAIQRAQHVCRPRLLRAQAAQRADRDRAVKSCGASLPAHVAQRDAQVLRSIAQEVVEVAAELAR